MSLAKELKSEGVSKDLRRKVRDLERAHADLQSRHTRLLLAVSAVAGYAAELRADAL